MSSPLLLLLLLSVSLSFLPLFLLCLPRVLEIVSKQPGGEWGEKDEDGGNERKEEGGKTSKKCERN
jgi:hypothetical protein